MIIDPTVNNRVKRILEKDPRFLKDEELREYNKIKKLVDKWRKQQELGEKYYDELKSISVGIEDIPFRKTDEFYKMISEMEDNKLEDYKESVKQEKEVEEKIKRLEAKDISEEIEEAEKKGEISKITSLKQKWMNVFKTRSFYNELYGEALFHSIVGQLFRNKPIYKGNERINLKLHLILVQKSGTGKGQGLSVAKDLIKKINGELQRRNEVIKDKLGLSGVTEFKFSDLKGQETDAVLLSRFKYQKDVRKGYDFTNTIPGKFERYDFYIYEEAGDFIKNRSYAKQESEYYLHILEDKPIEKELEKWSGHKTKTYGRGTLVAVSRELSNLDYLLMYSGLFQRCFTILRLIDNKTYMDMLKRASVDISKTRKDIEKSINEYEGELDDIAERLVDLYIEYIDMDMDIKDPEKINSLIMNLVYELNQRVNLELVSEEHCSIAKSFISRYPELIMKMMYHNAIIRGSEYVEMQDVVNAINMLRKSYDMMENWIQATVSINKGRKVKYNKFRNKLKNKLKKEKDAIITLKSAVNCFVYGGSWRVSKSRAYYLLDKFTSTSRQEFVKLIKEKKKYVGLRNNLEQYKKDGFKEDKRSWYDSSY